MQKNIIIGVDLDNTIVSYDELIYKLAVERGLIHRSTKKSKMHVRDTIRQIPNGENRWQELQAEVYGPRIKEAMLVKGVEKFFKFCRKNSVPVYIISHKTEFANYGKTKTNLRKSALEWMEKNKFFKLHGLGIKKENVHFESTRRDKIERIKKLGCSHFIDDLEETFVEESFPKDVVKILYEPHAHSNLSGVITFSKWDDINEYFFKPR